MEKRQSFLKRMHLEHRSQPVIPVGLFFWRMFRYFVFALLMIGLSVLIGLFGYRYYGNLSWIDSFHMSCLILTGMGPVIEMKSTAAKLFSSFYALYSGVAFLSIMAVLFSPIVHRLLHILHVDESDDNND